VTRIQHAGTLTVAEDLSYPPMAFRQAGAPEGFDVDLGRLLADALGVQFAVVDTPLASMREVLPPGVDAVIGALPEGVVPGRASDPYYLSHQGILSPARASVASAEALRGLRVAAAAGSRGAAVAAAAGATVETTYLSEQALAALALGRVQAALADQSLVFAYATDHRGLRAVGGVGPAVPFVVVVPEGAPDLAAFVSAAIRDLGRDGGLTRLRERWHL